MMMEKHKIKKNKIRRQGDKEKEERVGKKRQISSKVR
jgi:hypothetical protein